MGGFRRRLRRQARDAAKQLMKQGVPASSIGRVVEDERIKRALMRVVEGMEKRLDGAESPITVREGLAAIGTLLRINKQQAKAIDQAQELEEQAALEEELTENEAAAQHETRAPSASDGLKARSQPEAHQSEEKKGALSAAG